MIIGLHHVAILTTDMEDTLDFFATLFGSEKPASVAIDKPGLKFRTVMLPIGAAGSTFLQIIEPQEGPGVEELERDGEGALFEIGYRVEDLEAFNERMIAEGIAPVDLQGNPIDGQYLVSSFGNRYSFLPKDKTKGARSEFVQVMND